ncbi:MAG: dihydrofolate reductase [Bacteroidota bacterium]
MKRISNRVFILILASMTISNLSSELKAQKTEKPFNYLIEQFADAKIMRYTVPGFDILTIKQKTLVYYLSQAALCGRDIIWDQNCKLNLPIRNTLDAIVLNYKGDRKSKDFANFLVYVKRVWFSNGIHHHYSNDKFFPEISKAYFSQLIKQSVGGKFPINKGETMIQFTERLTSYIFDPAIAPKKISLDTSKDLILSSATNFYENVTQKEAEEFYANMMKKDGENPTPISYGLNSKLVKENGLVKEQVYKIGGLYSKAIEQIVFWLIKAKDVAENPAQKAHIEKLISFYQTGDLKTWDEYNVMWVKDTHSSIDYVNGFIEVYGDPMGIKATWESVVNFKDFEATKRTEKISGNAQWFESNSPVDEQFKKKEVKGVSAKVITVAQLGGDCYPTTPIGINLPNANWIRKDHGSKSVTMENITYAYDQAATGNGVLEEFCFSKEEIERTKKYGSVSDNLHTDMHECLGHGSGQMLPGVSDGALKNYHSALEEARADLFALYFMMDKKMVEVGLIESLEVAKAEYDKNIRNGLLMQLTRIEFGKDIEQAHMRNRALIANWCLEKGAAENVIEKKIKDNKTYFVINDYEKLRNLYGQLLKEIQRIKSTGDYEAGKKLVETYAVKINPEIHKEVLTRYAKLNVAPYGGFINPNFTLIEKAGKVIDVKISYPDDYTKQMLNYDKKYSFLK